LRTNCCLIDVYRDMIERTRRGTNKRDGPRVGAQLLGYAAKDRRHGQPVHAAGDKQTGAALDPAGYEDMRRVGHSHIVAIAWLRQTERTSREQNLRGR
jgi:hypothetical protein